MDNKAKKNKNSSPLHKKIGSVIQAIDHQDCIILKSLECGGDHNLPLFCSKVKGNDTEYCNADLLIIKNNKIKVIIEIEESRIEPIQICGKYLTTALSAYYIHESENKEIDMDDSALFIQILDRSKLPKKTSKLEQWKNLEISIQSIVPIEGSTIDKYRLFDGEKIDEIISFIQEVLN